MTRVRGEEITGEMGKNPVSGEMQKSKYFQLLTSGEAQKQVSGIIQSIREEGYAVLPDAITPEKRDEVERAVTKLNETTPLGRSEFEGYKTHRIYNLMSKSRVFDDLILHPKVLAIIEGTLNDDIQLSLASSLTLYPGQTAQPLHRDDGYYPIPRPHFPLIMNVIYAIDDFTAENGATVILPRSHLLADADPPADAEPISVAMPAGSAVIFDGGAFHGGGANVTTDQRRMGVSLLYNRAWLRQQENQYLAVPRDVVQQMPKEVQRMVGYWVAHNLLGTVEGRSPLHMLRSDA